MISNKKKMEQTTTINNGLVYMRTEDNEQTINQLIEEFNLFGDLSLLFSLNEDIGFIGSNDNKNNKNGINKPVLSFSYPVGQVIAIDTQRANPLISNGKSKFYKGINKNERVGTTLRHPQNLNSNTIYSLLNMFNLLSKHLLLRGLLFISKLNKGFLSIGNNIKIIENSARLKE